MKQAIAAPRLQSVPKLRNGVKYSKRQIVAAVRHEAELLIREGQLARTKEYIQHSNMTVYQHCCHVAYMCCLLSMELGIQVSYREMIRGALLHDYFLYDWHKGKHPDFGHAFGHPERALRNALRDYKLTEREMQIIRHHMWPLTVIPPTCREAWVIIAADKICTVLEVFRKERVRL